MIWRLVPRLKKELAEVEGQIKELDVPAGAYRKLRQAYDSARKIEEDVRADRNRLRKEQAQTRAQAIALPLLDEIDDLEKKIAPYSDYPDRLDINPEDLVALLSEQSRPPMMLTG